MYNRGAILTAVVAVLLVGCSGKPFQYHAIDEIKPGPGVFHDGEDGYTVFNSERKTAAVDFQPQSEEEFREFQAYQKWKRGQGSSGQSKEFQEWREWKEYREWKARQ